MSKLATREHYDLHDEAGEHRATCSTADGLRVAQHEAALSAHLKQHQAEKDKR